MSNPNEFKGPVYLLWGFLGLIALAFVAIAAFLLTHVNCALFANC